MRIGKKLVLGFLMIPILVSLVGYISFAQLNKITESYNKEIPASIEAIRQTSHLDNLAQLIRYYDEVLTQSARNYAFTQDKQWKIRYRNAEPKLDEIIKQAVSDGDEKDREFFLSVNKANLVLVEMEHAAIKTVDAGRATKAVEILQSDKYWNQKKVYEQGLRDYLERRGIEYDESLFASTEVIRLVTEETRKLVKTDKLLLLAVILIGFIVSALLGVFISRSISKPLSQLCDATIDIGKGELDVNLQYKSNDEIGTLISSFNAMALNLKEVTASRDELEQQVSQRKQADEKLRAANTKLESQVAQLAQARLAALNMMEDTRLAEEKLNTINLQLRDSEEKYRGVVENIGVGITVIDPELKILSLNKQMKEWLPGADLSKNTYCYEIL